MAREPVILGAAILRVVPISSGGPALTVGRTVFEMWLVACDPWHHDTDMLSFSLRGDRGETWQMGAHRRRRGLECEVQDGRRILHARPQTNRPGSSTHPLSQTQILRGLPGPPLTRTKWSRPDSSISTRTHTPPPRRSRSFTPGLSAWTGSQRNETVRRKIRLTTSAASGVRTCA